MIRESTKGAEIEIIIESVKEKNADIKPRVISDNSPQFRAKDFNEYIRIS